MSNTSNSMAPAGPTIPATGATAPAAPTEGRDFSVVARGDFIVQWRIVTPHNCPFSDAKVSSFVQQHMSNIAAELPCHSNVKPKASAKLIDIEDLVAEPKPPTQLRKKRRLVGIEENPGPDPPHKYPSFKFHGNYGGPGYSSGRFTDKPDWDVPSTDAVDEVFKKHDYDYGTMTHKQADALAVSRLKKLNPSPLSAAGLKAQVAALGFHALSGASKPPPDRQTYPWQNKLRPPRVSHLRGQSTPNPAPAAQGGGRTIASGDPVTLTSAGMAIHPNPGPPKSRSSKGRKRKKMPSKKRRKSTKGKRSRKGSKKKAKSGGGPRPGPRVRAPSAQGVVFSRTDLLFSGQVTSNQPGSVLYSAAVNPSGVPINGSQSIVAEYLNYEAAKFEMWDCSIHFIVKALGATTIAGTFTHGIDADVTDQLPVGTIAAVQRLTGQGGETQTFADGGRVTFNKLNRAKPVSKYWTQPANDSDSRSVAKGKYWLILNEPPQSFFAAGTGQSVSPNFQVFAEYTFRFFNATLEQSTSLSGISAGLVLNDPSSAGGAADPLDFTNVIGQTLDVPSIPASMTDMIVVATAGKSYIYFGTGAFDNLNYVMLTMLVAGTGLVGAVRQVGGGGGTPASSVQGYSILTSTQSTFMDVIGLSTQSASVTLSGTAYRKINGGWQTLLNPSFRHYGAVSLVYTSATTIASSLVTLSPFQSYVPTATDKMFLCAGPGTAEYKYIDTWDHSGSLELHIAECRKKDDQKEKDLRTIIADQRRLEAEHRLDMEYLSLTPPNSRSSSTEPLERKDLKSALRKPL